jgi:hypothetical protein
LFEIEICHLETKIRKDGKFSWNISPFDQTLGLLLTNNYTTIEFSGHKLMYATQQSARKNEISTNLLSYVCSMYVQKATFSADAWNNKFGAKKSTK